MILFSVCVHMTYCDLVVHTSKSNCQKFIESPAPSTIHGVKAVTRFLVCLMNPPPWLVEVPRASCPQARNSIRNICRCRWLCSTVNLDVDEEF